MSVTAVRAVVALALNEVDTKGLVSILGGIRRLILIAGELSASVYMNL